MNPTSKILWGEGLFLRPQHFQRQDAYHEWRLAQSVRNLHPYAWGLKHISIDQDALKAGQLRLLELQLVMPDGELYNAPVEDELPESLSLEAEFGKSPEFVVYAAMASLHESGTNFATTQARADTAVRYYPVQTQSADLFTNAASAPITMLTRSVKLVPDHDPYQHLVHLPLLRLRRGATGEYETDDRFVPTSMSIQSSTALLLQLRRIIDVLQAKVDALHGLHREPSKNIIEFRSGDVASFWLLHTASSAYAALSHLMRHPGLHPERFFERLLELAGALMTFSKGFTITDLPAYDHANPGPGFQRIDDILRELLETVISTRYFAIALSEVRPSFHQGRLDAEQITSSTTLYLGVSATLSPAELVQTVPARFKIGAPDDVEKLVLSAMSGVQLVHAPQVPAAIPVRPGSYYFAVEARGPLYERMLQAQAISIYAPGCPDDLNLELIAINP